MIYTASKVIHADKWKKLRAEGWPVIATWIDEAGVGQTVDFADLWSRCASEAARASVVLLYREPGEILKGAFVEAGVAIASGKPVFAIGCEEFSFVNHPLVQQFDDLPSALVGLSTLASPPPGEPVQGVTEAMTGWRDIDDEAVSGARILLLWKPVGDLSEHVELGRFSPAKGGWVNTYGKPFSSAPDKWAPLAPFSALASGSASLAEDAVQPHKFATNGPGIIGSDLCTICGKERGALDADTMQNDGAKG